GLNERRLWPELGQRRAATKCTPFPVAGHELTLFVGLHSMPEDVVEVFAPVIRQGIVEAADEAKLEGLGLRIGSREAHGQPPHIKRIDMTGTRQRKTTVTLRCRRS